MAAVGSMTAQGFASLMSGVDRAEIVGKRLGYVDPPIDLAPGIPGRVIENLDQSAAAEIAHMIGSLPPAVEKRCFFPFFGVQFLRDGERVSVALCFDCNNAMTVDGGERGWFAFDGESPEAKALLARLRRSHPPVVKRRPAP